MFVNEIGSKLIKTIGYSNKLRQMILEKTDGEILIYSGMSVVAYMDFVQARHSNVDYYYRTRIEPIYSVVKDGED